MMFSTLFTSPSAISLAGDAVTWSAEQIGASVNARCHELLAQDVGRGDRVLIAHAGTPAFFVDLFAVWKLGGCAICIRPDLTDNEFVNVRGFVVPKVTVLDDDGSRSDSAHPTLARATQHSMVSDPIEEVDTEPSAPSLVLFTSGTTAQPKGVVISRGALGNRLRLNLDHISGAALKTTLCVMPTYFGHGLIGNCLTALAAGGDLVLMNGKVMETIAQLADVVEARRISFMSSTPSFWRLALRSRRPQHKLIQVSIGSEPVSADLVEAVSQWAGTEDVRVMYGMTECANWISGYSRKDRPPEDGCVGMMWGGEAAVLTGKANVERYGEGEIVLRSPAMMSGYMERPDLTEETFEGDWFRTGDHGRVSRAGEIFLSGRLKDEINRAGMKIAPSEVEMLLERHYQVREACVFALPDLVAGELVGVALVLEPGVQPDRRRLHAWCGDRIRAECVPDRWYFVDSLPRTDRGKQDRRSLQSRFGGAN